MMARVSVWPIQLVLLSLWALVSVSAAEKPNILLVLVDDIGYSDLGCFGSEIATPNIDKLSKVGLTLTKALLSSYLAPRDVVSTLELRLITSLGARWLPYHASSVS